MGICGERKLICREAKTRPWVYLIVVFLSGFSSFLTWLALDSAGVPREAIRWWSGGIFLGVAIVLLFYYVSMMRRYCAHYNNTTDSGHYNPCKTHDRCV